MRIKGLNAKNYRSIKELNICFSERENIILVSEPYYETTDEILFDGPFFDLTNFLFFNDSYTYAKYIVNKNTVIECTLEKGEVEYTFGIKGNHSRTEKDGKVYLSKTLNWFCIVPERITQGRKGRRLESQLLLETQDFFYPDALNDFVRFDNNTYAESPANFVFGEEFSWLTLMAKCKDCKVDLEKKLRELIYVFNEIKINEHISVGLDEEKEYVLIVDGEAEPEEMWSEEEERLVNFCGWINNLNILKELCTYVVEDGNLPVFIDNVSEGVLAKYKEVLFQKLKETGRQVFIGLHKRNGEIEKYCDKIIEIGKSII